MPYFRLTRMEEGIAFLYAQEPWKVSLTHFV
jgi:hypothetical protein